MTKTVLVTNPSHDAPTSYLEAWFHKLIQPVLPSGKIKLIELKGDRVTSEGLKKMILAETPRFLVFNAHGNDKALRGFRDVSLVDTGDDLTHMESAIVHTCSCNCGALLGPHMIDQGVEAYIGYNKKFNFYHEDRDTMDDKQKDSTAALFLEPAFEVVVALTEGDSVERAYQRSQRKLLGSLRKAVTSTIPGYSTTIASHLFHNMKCQVVLGNSAAVL